MKRLAIPMFGLLATTLSLVGCSNSTDDQTVEANDLGITQIQIDHGSVNNDPLLTVRGLDDQGTEIATATLRTGLVWYGADMAPDFHPGTELNINVAGAMPASFVTPDRQPHDAYIYENSKVDSFVHLQGVAAAIKAEAGIGFARFDKTTSAEVALSGAACSGSRFPNTNSDGSSKASPVNCCQDNPYNFQIVNSKVGMRSTYVPVWPSVPVCVDSSGNTGCTSNCAYGPCGSQVVAGYPKGTTNGKVFHPDASHGGDGVCGWDFDSTTTMGTIQTDFNPENYVNETSTPSWANGTASCPYTDCKSDGSPGIHYIIAASCDNSSGFGTLGGSVTLNGNTVNCSAPTGRTDYHSLTVWVPYNTSQTLSHAGTGWSTWVGPSGCNTNGTCSGTWTTNTTLEGDFLRTL